jgi:hypothetical protein
MPTFSKQDAYNQAASRARSGATITDIIAEADKLYNYVNGTTGVSCASAAPKPKVNERTIPAVRFVAEYRNKNSVGTHLGNKLYTKYDGAAKNGRSKNSSLRSRFIKVVKLVESRT